MEMSRTDFARWLLFAVVCWTFVAAYAGSVIGVILGALYVVAALIGTLIDEIERNNHGEEDD